LGALKNIFPHANTIVCIEESKLLKQVNYEILHSATGLQAALDELNGMNYFQSPRIADIHNYGAMQNGLMKTTFELIRNVSPIPMIWCLFALYYDIHNMKLVVKERFFGRRFDDLALDYGNYSLPTIRSAAVKRSDNILRDDLLTDGFFKALELENSYDIDFVLDNLYFKALKHMASKLRSPIIDEFIIEKIDLFNISLLFQAMAAGYPEGYFERGFSGGGACPLAEWLQYLDVNTQKEMQDFSLWKKYKPIWSAAGGKHQLFSEIDVWIDNYLIEKTKVGKQMAFGVEPICAYFFNKMMEMKNIRILLEGKAKNYSQAEIRKRMRISYEV